MTVKLPVRPERLVSGRDLHTTQPVTPGPHQKKSLFDTIPLPLVMFLAKPYLAGQTSAAAISKAHELYQSKKFTGTLDILGEDATTVEDCERYVTTYMSLIDEVTANQLHASNKKERLTISMKPSMFSTTAPAHGAASEKALEAAFDRINKIVDYAFQRGVDMTLEAEDHRWTNFHLESYLALYKAGYKNLGTVIQSRLFRTEKDIARFEEGMRVRMVIGIYNEPASIAHTEKPIMKELAVRYSRELAHQGVYLELASHDTKCVDNFVNKVVLPLKLKTSQFEFQFLLGVPRAKLQDGLVNGSYFSELSQKLSGDDEKHALMLAQTGAIVRMYLPYGRDQVAGPYCRRRLKNNPNMIAFGIKNVLGLK